MPAREADLADLALLTDAARDAGALVMEWFEKGAKIFNKGGTPVTEADHASNALLGERLRGARPDYGWLSEETHDDAARLSATRIFIVDPLDGTVSFIKRKDDFTIAVAVIDGDEPVAGAVFNPVKNEMFAAAKGHGATLNGAPIRAGSTVQLEHCRMIGPRDMFQHPAWREPWPPMEILKIGSIAYRLALVAADRADATLALSTKSDWDIAAGEIVAREAGVRVTDHQGNPLRYNREATHQISLVAATDTLHAEILGRVSSLQLPYRGPARAD